MKLFKTITNCVIAILLILSLTINILVFSGYRLIKEDKNKTYVNSTTQTNKSCQSTDDEDSKEPRELVYQDNNITVTYFGVKEDCAEPTYLFEISNTSSKTLNITFTNLFINRQRVYVSGLTCEKLLPGTSVTEDFVVKESEYPHDKNSELKLIFNIKLMNAKSYLDLYETESVTVVV